jgi:hypothetical protein
METMVSKLEAFQAQTRRIVKRIFDGKDIEEYLERHGLVLEIDENLDYVITQDSLDGTNFIATVRTSGNGQGATANYIFREWNGLFYEIVEG